MLAPQALAFGTVVTFGKIDLDAIARRLAGRDAKRAEAKVQSGLHALILEGPLELEEDDLQDNRVS